MTNNTVCIWTVSLVILVGDGLVAPTQLVAKEQVQKGEMAGYLLVPNDRVDRSYNGGFSMYVSAWPLLRQYR